MKSLARRIKRLLMPSLRKDYDYRAELEKFFLNLGIQYENAEKHLREATGGECLYFKSDSGQQLEALIFSALSLHKRDVRSILEIGTGNGGNTVILASLFPDARLHTFDLPKNDRDYNTLAWRRGGEENSFAEKIAHERIIFHEKNSFYLLSENLSTFDLAYVDGGHSYPALAWDAMYAYNMVNPGGFIVFHDYNRSNNDPARDANHVKDFIDNYLRNIVKEEIHYLPWAGYDTQAKTCLIIKQ